jgi:hypothetical protein
MRHRAAAITLLLLAANSAAAGPRTLLLVDDHHVLYRSGLRREVVPLVRHPNNPLIPGKPKGQLGYCTTYRDPATGKYQLWYQTTAGGHGVAYAESDDGIKWNLPNLDLVKLNDPEQRNIVLTSADHYGASVVVDAPGASDPSRRYKLAYWSIPKIVGERPADGDDRGTDGGVYVAFSPDGIHWTKHSDGPVIRGAYGRSTDPPLLGDVSYRWGPPLTTSDVVDASWDPIRKRYVIYAKGWIDSPDGKTFWKRCVVRTESEDFIKWTQPQLAMVPDEFDGHRPAEYGGTRRGVQLHGAPVFVHEGVYFALLQPAFFESHGLQPIELAISRDGIDWQRPWRSTFLLPVDGGTSFDSGRIWSSSTPIVLDDEIRFYYGAYEHPWNTSPKDPKSGIGLATMKRDRFVALRPIEDIGQVTLKPIRLASLEGITINADGSKGSVRVELLNEDGYRVAGFTKNDAVPITTDALRHRVAWKPSDAKFAPGNYIVRVHLDRADLFAIMVPEK